MDVLNSPDSLEINNYSTAVENGTVYITSLKPEVLKSDNVVLFIPGQWENQQVYEDSMQAMASTGREVMLVKDPIRNTPRHGNIFWREAHAIAHALEPSLGERQVDIVAHSKGSLVAMRLAEQWPDLVHSMVLVGAAGTVEHANNNSRIEKAKLLGKLVTRFSHKLGTQLKQGIQRPNKAGRLAKSGLQAGKEFVKHPVASVKRVWGISQTSIVNRLASINRSGTPVVMFVGNNDRVFPPSLVQEAVDAKAVTGYVAFGNEKGKLADGRKTVPGYHDDDHIDFEQMIPAIESVISTLDKS